MTDRLLLPLPAMRVLTLPLLMLAAWPPATAAARPASAPADPVVVVAANNPLSSMRRAELAAIFLAQTDRFPDGRAAVALDLPLGSAPRELFYQRVAGRSPTLMKQYWTKQVFTGQGRPPREVASSGAVRRLVAGHADMIGYIDRRALDASVKVLAVLP